MSTNKKIVLGFVIVVIGVMGYLGKYVYDSGILGDIELPSFIVDTSDEQAEADAQAELEAKLAADKAASEARKAKKEEEAKKAAEEAKAKEAMKAELEAQNAQAELEAQQAEEAAQDEEELEDEEDDKNSKDKSKKDKDGKDKDKKDKDGKDKDKKDKDDKNSKDKDKKDKDDKNSKDKDKNSKDKDKDSKDKSDEDADDESEEEAVAEPVKTSAVPKQFARAGSSDATGDSENIGKVYKFRNSRKLADHYEKHGKAMGFDSAEAYEAAASEVVNDKSALCKTEKEDGDLVYYLERTNELVIISTDGFIRTYFKPDDGRAYFDRQ